MKREGQVDNNDKKHQAYQNFRDGRLDEALKLYQELCDAAPGDHEAHYNLATALKAMGRHDDAELAFRHALQAKPDYVEAHHNLGNCLAALGRLDEAARCYDAALQIQPNAFSHYGMGNVHLRRCSWSAAVQHYRAALVFEPRLSAIHLGLGDALAGMGDDAAAETAYREALQIEPDFVAAHRHLGLLLTRRHRYAKAERHFREAVRLRPGAVSHFDLATVLARQHHNAEAVDNFRAALRHDPGNAEAWNNLGNVYRQQNRFPEAEQIYRKVLQLDAAHLNAHVNLGTALLDQGRPEEAHEVYRRALALDPTDRKAMIGLANSHEKQGDFQRAYELLRPYLQPDTIDADAALAFSALCRPLGRGDDAVPMLEGVLRRDDAAMDAHDRLLVHFALGRLLDAAGEYERAFEHYRRGNELADGQFDSAGNHRHIDETIAVYSPAFSKGMARSGNGSQQPVFIVGMLRSGTSLVEQILASHSAVFGAGEQDAIDRIAAGLQGPAVTGAIYPQAATALTAASLSRLAEHYLEQVGRGAPAQCARITDKMPGNFLYLGLIAQLFPQARIIHCVRDPLDTCLSCYFQHFGWRLSYTKDLRQLGEFYVDYRRLMAHWHSVLDLPIMEVRYEALVSDPQGVSRAMVDFCGLEWEERCLTFYESKRVVATASYDQVRQPIYHRSVGRWRHYLRHLDPLTDTLGPGRDGGPGEEYPTPVPSGSPLS